ncbi:cAMP and cAMP-inhibited cGMP 3',5'-cyclic phosphodiesterase 10A-like isoform X2 [Rhodnius prolixus]|uniref:cAMP and cAMP-inhibited cGMP 3',5'-cyclic phosphodiesterase 10A-like isoform X2 n=1 Tax=Rhodnius prolixus TaxID=13249 RepID=UPI003D18CA0B
MNIVRINPYLKYKSNINLEKADISKTSQKKLAKMSDFCDDLQDLNYEFIGLLGYVTNTLQMRTILLDTANLLRDYTDSSGVVLHLKSDLKEELIQCSQKQINWKYMKTQKIEAGTSIAAYVAYSRKYVLTSEIIQQKDCPFGTDIKGSLHKHVFCFPLIAPSSNQLIGVIELFKDVDEEPYDEVEVEGVLNSAMWLVASIEEDYFELSRCRKANLPDLLLEMVLGFLQTDTPPLTLMSDMMLLVRKAVNASALAISLVKEDEVSGEVSFQMTACDKTNVYSNTSVYDESEKVKTVTGTVIKTGQVLNLTDSDVYAYDTTKYFPLVCRNILSLPVKFNDVTKAVVEFLTKVDRDGFNYDDIYLCTTSLAYCAYFVSFDTILKEKNSKLLLTKILRHTIEMVGAPCVHDLLRMATERFKLPKNFDKTVQLYLEEEDKIYLCFLAREIFMKHAKILAPKKILTLNYFILLIQRYTPTEGPYNFMHTVRTMYILNYILNKYPRDFSPIETSEMMLAALCHGIPHSVYRTYFKDDMVVEYFDEKEDKIYLNKPSLFFKNIIKLSRWIIGKKMKQYRIKIEKVYRLMTLCPFKYYLQERSVLGQLLLDDRFNWNKKFHRNNMQLWNEILNSRKIWIPNHSISWKYGEKPLVSPCKATTDPRSINDEPLKLIKYLLDDEET